MIEFKLPSLGADMDEGKLLEWRVQPGDPVKKGDIVAVVDTTKSAIDVESWHEGTVDELVAQPGDTLPVGAVMALLREPGETPAQAEAWKRARTTQARAPAAPTVAPQPAPPAAAAEAARRRVSPAARKRAAELGVELAAIAGTGPEGAVTLEDVEGAATAKAAPATPADRAAEMRRTIAAAMARSKREIPHYYLSTEVPLTRASAWLEAENAKREVTGRLLMAVLFLKATALALKRYPDFNGLFRDGRFEPGTGIHIGVAISLRQGGLIAPALHDVDARSLDQVMAALADLVQRARAFSLRSSEFSDPTVTVTNLGDQGVDLVHGIIYPPQVALVGFGRVGERVWAEDGKPVVGPAVTASLSADHRVSDGHRGALLLAEIARLLQEPEKL
ncbi:MAG TPA: dihydrolipoamide acetyltransferase family protein [Burkholderiales bacterium]|nr:dihydrolipoamide acetyltransferase family protein [Burkholderiales bacterium]